MLNTLHISPEGVQGIDAGWDPGEFAGQFEGAWANAESAHQAEGWASEFAQMPPGPMQQMMPPPRQGAVFS